MINHQHTAFLGIGLVAILVQLTMHLQLLAEDPPTLAKVSRIPFETKFGLVTVKASLNNKLAGNFTVDSGASFCIVDERVASGLEIEPGMHIATLDTEEAHLLDLYHDVRLSIDGSDEQYVNNFSAVNLKRFVSVMGIPLHGVIGAPFFQNQRLRFDFDENVLSVGAGDLIAGGKGGRRKRCQEPNRSVRHKRFLTPLQSAQMNAELRNRFCGCA